MSRSNEDQITIQRLKRGIPVTSQDLEQLEDILFEASGIENRDQYAQVIHPDKPLGVFIRELVGLDQNAAKEAFADYLNDASFNATQIDFINTIINWLCQNGTMEPSCLYDPPFTQF